MLKQEINFDRFVRGLILLSVCGVAVFLINHLSSVLLPFVVAWALAYLLYPVVRFLQYKCRFRNRMLCVLIAVLAVIGALTGLCMAAVPSIQSEWHHLKEVAMSYLEGRRQVTGLTAEVQQYIMAYAQQFDIDEFLAQYDLQATLKEALPKLWGVVSSTAGAVINVLSSLFALIYLFLLLLDYERYAEGWIKLVPRQRQPFARQLAADIERGMSGYFRGQGLVALSNCLMFTLGFWIVGFPLPVLMGVFIGLVSFVPYLQLIGYVPAVALALIKSADTGQSFWVLIGLVTLVYIVIQVIQDTFVTPRIMGHIMGLPSAIVLLALTAWGYALGIIGLIIALPATTLFISYYRRYVVGNADSPAEQ